MKPGKAKLSKALVYGILAVIAVSGLLLSLSMYAGITSYFDDSYYVYYGHLLLNNNYSVLTTVGPVVSGFLKGMPIALSYLALGTNSFAAVLPSILEYLGLMLLVFLIGREVANEGTGLIAALLFAFAPFVVGYVTRVLPDLFVGLVASAGLYLFYKSADFKRNAMIGYTIAGFIVGMTIYVKIEALIFIALMVLLGIFYMVFDRSSKTRSYMMFFIFGVFLALFIDAVIFFNATGNPLFMITAYTHPGEGTTLAGYIASALLLLNPWTFGVTTYISIASYLYPMGLVGLLFLIGAALGIARGGKDMKHLSVLGLGIFLYMIFGSASIHSYQPIPINDRYFILEAVSICVGSAYLLYYVYAVAERRWSRNIGLAAILLILVLIFILNVPLYSMLAAYNGGIHATDIRYQALADSIMQYHGNSSIGNLSVIAIGRYPRSQGRYFGLLLNYNKSIYIGPQLSDSCNSTYNGNLLLYLYSFFSESQYANQTTEWLGDNCSAIEIENESIPLGSIHADVTHYGANNYGVLYRIVAPR